MQRKCKQFFFFFRQKPNSVHQLFPYFRLKKTLRVWYVRFFFYYLTPPTSLSFLPEILTEFSTYKRVYTVNYTMQRTKSFFPQISKFLFLLENKKYLLMKQLFSFLIPHFFYSFFLLLVSFSISFSLPSLPYLTDAASKLIFFWT